MDREREDGEEEREREREEEIIKNKNIVTAVCRSV